MWLNSDKVQNCWKIFKLHPNCDENETTKPPQTGLRHHHRRRLQPVSRLFSTPHHSSKKACFSFFCHPVYCQSAPGVGGGHCQYGGAMYNRPRHQYVLLHCPIASWPLVCVQPAFFSLNNCKFATTAGCHTLSRCTLCILLRNFNI